MSRGSVLLYAVLPYAALAVFAVGTAWRYRNDQYGWGARSTQLLESRVLRYGSTVFHLGVLAAIGGHVLGILVPPLLDRERSASPTTPTTCSRSPAASPPGPR